MTASTQPARLAENSLGLCESVIMGVAGTAPVVSGTIPAATATLELAAPRLIADPAVVTLVSGCWLLAVSAVVVRGIKPASYTQVVLTSVEVAIMVAIIVAAVSRPGAIPAHAFSTLWLSPGGFTPAVFATGALTAVFFFWGWDVTLNLNEETQDATQTPGLGAVLSMIIVLCLFVGFAIATPLVLSDAEIEQAGTNVMMAVADKLFPRSFSYMAVIAVMLSTIGTIETSLLQFTRTLFVKARAGALHPRYARLHPQWQTPWVASTVFLVVIALDSIPTFDAVTNVMGLGGIAAGLVPYALNRRRAAA